jgi:hypothetical protein
LILQNNNYIYCNRNILLIIRSSHFEFFEAISCYPLQSCEPNPGSQGFPLLSRLGFTIKKYIYSVNGIFILATAFILRKNTIPIARICNPCPHSKSIQYFNYLKQIQYNNIQFIFELLLAFLYGLALWLIVVGTDCKSALSFTRKFRHIRAIWV